MYTPKIHRRTNRGSIRRGLKHKKWLEMPRKCITKVVLSKEQKEILLELARRLGTSESETLRMALMDYAKELSLLKERVQRTNTNSSEYKNQIPPRNPRMSD